MVFHGDEQAMELHMYTTPTKVNLSNGSVSINECMVLILPFYTGTPAATLHIYEGAPNCS